jgi:hypothetical protein
MDVKYPKVKVQLSGLDGNAFFIIGRVRSAMKAAGIASDEIEAMAREAVESPSYDALLQYVMRTVRTA